MANEVYLITHDNLSNIVSSRAASRVLDKALKAKGHTIGTVSKEQMHEVLVGPVFKELQLILPSDGVKRTIQHITRILAEEAPVNEVVEELTPAANTEQPEGGVDPAVNIELAEASPQAQPDLSLLSEPEVVELKKDFSLDEVESGLLDFAQLEHIQTVVSVKTDNGEVVSSRGSGFDLSSLSRLANMSLKLLEHRGAIRSYHLEHKKHHLFLVPLGQYLMIIIGATQLNVGEVFSKVTAMREMT